ncbi:ferredoxin [Candidatus Roizmanbacteria bacterium]|nr:ferredoxin [Candidatus Roizmanbacteria bacterium]
MGDVTTHPVTTSDGKKVTVKIDRNLCIGAASCVAVAPKMFALDNEAKAIVLDTAGEESFQAAVDAAKSCPVAAIFIVDEQGNQVYPS